MQGAKALHDKACTSCHTRMYGGDGSKMYTRDGRMLSNKLELLQRVAACNAQVSSGWFPEEESAVAAGSTSITTISTSEMNSPFQAVRHSLLAGLLALSAVSGLAAGTDLPAAQDLRADADRAARAGGPLIVVFSRQDANLLRDGQARLPEAAGQ